MSPAALLTVALFVAGLGASVLAYWIRRNDSTTAETLAEVKSLGQRLDRVTHAVFGPNNDNGLHGDNLAAKRRMHRADGFIQAVCLFFGLECDERGAVRILPDESPFERRVAEQRRSGHGRRANDPA